MHSSILPFTFTETKHTIMIASEALKAKQHLANNPNLHGHHTFIDCDKKDLIHWAAQFGLPIFVTHKGRQITYQTDYLGRQITITLKATK